VRRVVGAEQHGRLVAVDQERLRPRGVLGSGAKEPLDAGARVAAVQPGVVRPEPELREASVVLDRLDGLGQLGEVDAVGRRTVLGGRHGASSDEWWKALTLHPRAGSNLG